MVPASELIPQARLLLAGRLSPASLAHCERTGAQARALAQRHGVDPDAAELAGLLHDWCRDESDDGLLEQAEALGVPVIAFEREHPYLLHARVAAAMIRRDLPGAGESVLSAVASHTVGAVPMSDLEKVVYLADMIEPARDYEGVAALRASCASDTLAECFRRGYARSLRYLMDRGRPVHPISAAVMASIERETGLPLFDQVGGRS